jgi:hypothetical protein
MLRSDLVAGERFDPDDGPYADLALWLRVATKAGVGYLSSALSGYLVHSGSASSGFHVVRVRLGQHRMTGQHADAVLQAHGRFVQRADLAPDLREDLARTVAEADRRLRWTIRANQAFSPGTLRTLKRVSGWSSGGRLHQRLALDGAPPGP